MTSKDKYQERNRLLEQILTRVQSIDRNVEEILDRVGDHFDEQRLDLSWQDHAYGEGRANGHGYRDDHE